MKWGLPAGGRVTSTVSTTYPRLISAPGYYRSSRIARLEGSELADSEMGFYDKKIRDKVYY